MKTVPHALVQLLVRAPLKPDLAVKPEPSAAAASAGAAAPEAEASAESGGRADGEAPAKRPRGGGGCGDADDHAGFSDSGDGDESDGAAAAAAGGGEEAKSGGDDPATSGGDGEFEDALGAGEPCIVFMDSLGMHNHAKVTRWLRQYVAAEWDARHRATRGACPVALVDPAAVATVRPRVPTQDNSCDCGVYLLEYAEQVRCISSNGVAREELAFSPLHRKRSSPRRPSRS